MPFTLSHIAAALPFRRLGLVLPAVVIGTLSPDFEYFLLLAPRGGFGHTIPGLFLLSLPLGLAVFWLFYAFVQGPLLLLLPNVLRSRIALVPRHRALGRPSHLLLVLLSLLAGALTHILWDSFTHPRGWLYAHWPLLHAPIPILLLGSVPCYKLLQHASSILGAAVFFLWLVRWFRSTPATIQPTPSPAVSRSVRIARVALPLAVVLGAALRAQVGVSLRAGQPGFEVWMGLFAVAGVSLAGLALLGWAFIARLAFPADLQTVPQAR